MGLLERLTFGRRARGAGRAEGDRQRDRVAASGLFDAAYYLAEAADVAAAGVDPLDHFLSHGWRDGRRPNPLFDPGWYAHVHMRGQAPANALVHYIEGGEAAGCRPVAYFDTAWYRRAYRVAGSPLRHYLAHRSTRAVAPNAHFDLPFYLAAHGEEIAAGRDPFAHLIEHGGRRDLDPSPVFDSAAYRRRHMPGASLVGAAARELNVPLVHCLDEALRAPAGIPPYVVKLGIVHMPESEIAVLAAIYARGGEAAEALVREMAAIEPGLLNNFLLHLRVAIAVRENHSTALAEALLARFVDEPVLRKNVLNELMNTWAYDGRPGEATRCFEALARDGTPTLKQKRFASWCYARDGKSEQAFALLEEVQAEEPSTRKECAASAQFYRFYQRYGPAAAEALLADQHRLFPRPASIAALEAEIGEALRAKRPYLLLRLGDGEGVSIRISDEDEAQNADYYEANRREFLHFWFQDESLYGDAALDQAMRDFNAVIAQADCIGAIYREVVEHEYRIGSRRGIVWVVNTMRALLQRGRENFAWATRTMLFPLRVHYELLLSGALGRLIEASGRIGLISCHAELPGKIASRFGVQVCEFHKIPGEKIHSGILGEDAAEGVHWPDRFHELCAIFDEPADRRGQLFLVAAGILGKVYAAKLKRSGAVVIDIGAVADLWMGKATREFPALPREVSLEPSF